MTDREARRRLHHKLIDIEDKPCLWCASKQDREIDRVKEGYQGGKYIMSNVRVLCLDCHIKRHNRCKFSVGDQVTINGRCPRFLVNQLRHNRLRTIIAVYYDADRRCCYYSLGYNKLNNASWDIEAYPFRSYQLQHPISTRGVGRPRTKRQYVKLNCTVKNSSQKRTDDIVNQVEVYQLNAVLN